MACPSRQVFATAQAFKKFITSFTSTPTLLPAAKNASACEAAPKREKAGVYVEGLLTNGGPSTDVFKKGIGSEKTADLFRRILFATQA
jgi:hypothetical protein